MHGGISLVNAFVSEGLGFKGLDDIVDDVFGFVLLEEGSEARAGQGRTEQGKAQEKRSVSPTLPTEDVKR